MVCIHLKMRGQLLVEDAATPVGPYHCATLALEGAEAAFRSLQSSLRNELLQQRAAAAVVESDHLARYAMTEAGLTDAVPAVVQRLAARMPGRPLRRRSTEG